MQMMHFTSVIKVLDNFGAMKGDLAGNGWPVLVGCEAVVDKAAAAGNWNARN